VRAGRPVAEPRRRLRAVQEQHVREVGHGDAERRARAVLPVLGDGLAVEPADVELCERARHRVESRREDEDVGFDLALLGAEPLGCHFDDGVLVDVDDVDVGQAEDLVDVLLEAGTLGAEGVRGNLGGQESLLLWIGNAFEHCLPPELVRLVIGLLVGEDILVPVQPESESAIVDQLLVESLALFRGVVEGVLVDEGVREAGKGIAGLLDLLLVPAILLLLLFLLGVKLLLVHRQAEVGRSLEDGEVFDLGTDRLEDLDPASTCANLRDPLAPHIDVVLRPYGGMVDFSLEVTQALDGRSIFLGSETQAGDEPSTIYLRVVRAFDEPLIPARVERCTIDMLVEHHVLAQIPFLVNVIEVPAKLLLTRIPLGKGEVFPEFLVEDLINRGSGVDTSSRLAKSVF